MQIELFGETYGEQISLRVDMLKRLSRHIKPWPLFWSLLSLSFYLLSLAFNWPEIWQGMLLAIPLMIVTIGWGWRGGLLVLPLGFLILWLSQLILSNHESWIYFAGIIPVMLIGIVGADSIFRLWRGAEQRAKRNARQARLLSKAIVQLQHTKTAEEVFATLPKLLSEILSFNHAEVFVPSVEQDSLRLMASYRWNVAAGFEVPLQSVTGRAYLNSEQQYVANTQADPEFITAPNAPLSRSELAIPLKLDDEVVAVLNIENSRQNGFDAGDRRVLRAFVNVAEEALLRNQRQEQLEQQGLERKLTAKLGQRLLSEQSASNAAKDALEELQKVLTFDLGVILIFQRSHFRPLALVGQASDEVMQLLKDGLPWGQGQLSRSWTEKRAIFSDDYQQIAEVDAPYRYLGIKSAASVPISNADGEVRALLELVSFDKLSSWRPKEQLLISFANTLGLALERATVNNQLREMLEVVRQLAQADDPSQLYQTTVEAAVRLIPESDTASLLVRAEDGFSFKGAYGFDKKALESVPPFSEQEQLHWYGNNYENFIRGLPRIVRGNQVVQQSLSATTHESGKEILRDAGKLSVLKSNICVPITYHQEVVGLLNIDSVTREDAFGNRALSIAEAFAQQIAIMIRQKQYREALERNVITDTLTGLGNRAGFNKQLRQELATAKRYLQPLSLIIMDLNGFKQVNDSLGHQKGDEALVAVARVMSEVRRNADYLYRWGGDEFALILPQTNHNGAEMAVARYTEAIEQIKIDGLGLSASVGIASYPRDGEDDQALIKYADNLMYQQKALSHS